MKKSPDAQPETSPVNALVLVNERLCRCIESLVDKVLNINLASSDPHAKVAYLAQQVLNGLPPDPPGRSPEPPPFRTEDFPADEPTVPPLGSL